MFGRQKVAILVAEFVGTFSLASVVLAMFQVSTYSFFSGIAAGLTFGLLSLLFVGVETGFYNPAVTIALWTMRQLDALKTVTLLAVQALAAVVAWTANAALLNTTLRNIANPKLDLRIFAAEAIGAALLGMGIVAALAKGYQGLRYAVTVGSSLTLGMILASFAGHGLVNPAVAGGVQSWSLVYAMGPLLGTLVGMNLYAFLFTDLIKPRRSSPTRASKVTTKKTPTKQRSRK